MALFTVAADDWAEIVALSQLIRDGRDKIAKKWEEVADKLEFIAATIAVHDEEKGMIEAEPRPNPEYIRQKRLLLITEAVHGLSAEDRILVAKLAEIDPKIPLQLQLQLVQEGADAADAIQAEDVELRNEDLAADAVLSELREGETPN